MCIGKFFNPRAACYRLMCRRSNVRLQAYAETAKTPGCIAIRAFVAFFIGIGWLAGSPYSAFTASSSNSSMLSLEPITTMMSP